MSGSRLDFELDHEVGLGTVTAHGGVPALIAHFRSSGAAAAVDGSVPYKRRKRGLSASEMCESLLALWSCGGEPCEDLDRLRGRDGLELLLGHGLPAAQTARDFLSCFEEPDLPLLGGGRSAVREEGLGLRALSRASAAVVADLQARSPQRVATIDVDATILASSKRAARPCYDGRRGYQPVVALWAEQDAIVADEFRDGNVSAQSGNRRVIEGALAALPEGVDRVFLRVDSALRHWAVLDYLPDGAIDQPDGVVRRLRYIAIRISRKQGSLFADGETVKHFCVVTNRDDPQGGDAGDLLRWHRDKAGTVEHADDVLANELAAAALPSQKFGANAAWFRLNVVLYNLLSAFKRLGLRGAASHPAQAAALSGAQHSGPTDLSCPREGLAPRIGLRAQRARPLLGVHPRPPPLLA